MRKGARVVISHPQLYQNGRHISSTPRQLPLATSSPSNPDQLDPIYVLAILVTFFCVVFTLAVFILVNESYDTDDEEFRKLIRATIERHEREREQGLRNSEDDVNNSSTSTVDGFAISHGTPNGVESHPAMAEVNAEALDDGMFPEDDDVVPVDHVNNFAMVNEEILVQQQPQQQQAVQTLAVEDGGVDQEEPPTQPTVLEEEIIQDGEEVLPTTQVPLPPPPRPLMRRDSAQSEDYDMTALHYFCIANRPIEDVDKACLLAKEASSSAFLSTVSLSTGTTYLSSDSPSSISSSSSSQIQNSTKKPLGKALPFHIDSPCRFIHLTPLHFATMNSEPTTIRLLLAHGANINARDSLGRTALRHAACVGRLEILTELLDAGAKDLPDKDGVSTLRYAVIKDETEILRAYVRCRPQVLREPMENHQGKNNNRSGRSRQKKDTAADADLFILHTAASLGFVEMVDMLVFEFGADTNVRDRQGRTALMYAAARAKVEVIDVLLRRTEELQSTDSSEEEAGNNATGTETTSETSKDKAHLEKGASSASSSATLGLNESEDTLAEAGAAGTSLIESSGVNSGNQEETQPPNSNAAQDDDDAPLSNLGRRKTVYADIGAFDDHGVSPHLLYQTVVA
jgi:ankyrin repeat protein